jgi:hypothetical protein
VAPACHPNCLGSLSRKVLVRLAGGKIHTIPKITKAEWNGNMVQVLECLSNKQKGQVQTPISYTQKN